MEGASWLFSLGMARGQEEAPGRSFWARFLALFLPILEVIFAVPDPYSGPHWACAIFFNPNIFPPWYFLSFKQPLSFKGFIISFFDFVILISVLSLLEYSRRPSIPAKNCNSFSAVRSLQGELVVEVVSQCCPCITPSCFMKISVIRAGRFSFSFH